MSSEELAREAADPGTSAARLQQIAQADRSTWTAIAAHPAAYPGLLEWLGEHGDDDVRAAIAARSLTPPPPPPPPAPPAPPAPETVEAPVAPGVTETVEVPAASEPDVEPTQQLAATPEPTQVLATPAVGAADAGGTTTEAPAEAGAGKPKPWLGLVIVAAIVAIAAGGYFGVRALNDDDDSGVDLTSSSQSTDDAKDDDDDADADDAPSGGGDKGEFCTIMKDFQDTNLGMMKDLTSSGDPDAFKDTFKDLAKTYADLEDAAPADLKDDVSKMRDFVDDIAEGGVGAAASSSGQMDGYLDAATKVTTYYYSECF